MLSLGESGHGDIIHSEKSPPGKGLCVKKWWNEAERRQTVCHDLSYIYLWIPHDILPFVNMPSRF